MKPAVLLPLGSAALAMAGWSLNSAQEPIQLDASLNVPGKNPLEFCEDPQNDLVKIMNVDLDPNPPKAGEALLIEATGNFTETIEDGAYIYIEVFLRGIRFLHRREDLCRQLENVDKKCPLEPGVTTITKEVALPKEIPPAEYVAKASVFTKDEVKITCLKAKVAFNR